MVRLTNRYRLITVCTLISTSDGRGRASGWKTNAVMEMEESIEGQKVRHNINVAFWNSKDSSKPQLAGMIKDPSLRGAQLLCLLAKDEVEYTCLAFTKEGIFSLKGEDGITRYIGLGRPKYKMAGKGAIALIPERYRNYNRYNLVALPGLKDPAILKARFAFVAEKKEKIRTRRGSLIDAYVAKAGSRVPENRCEDIMIDIGPYKESPAKLYNIIDQSHYKDDVMYWLRFVANRWQCEPGKQQQKAAIKAYVDSLSA